MIPKQRGRFLLVTATISTLLLSSVASAEVTENQLTALDAYLETEASRFNLPNFALAVTSQGKIVHEEVSGRGVESDSAFVIGSCSKTVTALATLLALDGANVDIQTPVQEILPSLEILGAENPLCVTHLLYHYSGLTRSQGFDALPSLASLESEGHTIKPQHEPGTQFDYSNLNYSILGLVIEKLSGQSFAEFVSQHVFTPAGMTSSSCSLEENSDQFAPEYQYCFGFTRKVDAMEVPDSRVPSGFIRCSIGDLARLQLIIANDGSLDDQQIFNPSLIQQMKMPPNEQPFGYAMGLVVGNHRLGPLVAHEGATPTSYAFHGRLAEDDLGFVFLTNVNLFDPFTDHGEAIYENILRILKDEEPEPTRPIRIWIRWVFLALVVFTVWQLATLLLRWRKSGWAFTFPTSQDDRVAIAVQFLIPLAIWYGILHWIGMPLSTILQMEPDVMWSVVFLTISGVFTGCLKKCVPKEVFSK